MSSIIWNVSSIETTFVIEESFKLVINISYDGFVALFIKDNMKIKFI